MEFSAEQNAHVPTGFAFRKATDHAAFAQIARDYGVRMEPLVPFVNLTEDCGWRISGPIRGREVECDVVLEEYAPDEAFALRTVYRGVDFLMAVELESLGDKNCRIYVDLSTEAQTLAARLAMKAAALTSGRLQKRFRRSVRKAALWLEAEYKVNPKG